jgi:hypothetical protein
VTLVCLLATTCPSSGELGGYGDDPPPDGDGLCQDQEGFLDAFDTGCDFYAEDPSWCDTAAGAANAAGEHAGMACCECGGGYANSSSPSDGGDVDGSYTGSTSTGATAVVTCSGYCACTPSAGTTSGEISDGSVGHMENYDNNANCSWVIASDGQISLSFTLFETEANYDFVHVYRCDSASCSTREQIAKLSGSTTYGTLCCDDADDATYTSSTGFLQVVFTSDGADTEDGFVAEWTSRPFSTVGSSGPGSHFASDSGSGSAMSGGRCYDILAGGGSCTDQAGFLDRDGQGCDVYADLALYCDTAADYANDNGVHAGIACCACSSEDWRDKDDARCIDYADYYYCQNGGYGSGWHESWGPFSDYAVDGIDASQACCACGGGTSSPSRDISPSGVGSGPGSGSASHAGSGSLEDGSGGSGWGSGSASASHAGSGSFEDGSGGSGWGSGSGSASHAGSGSFEDGSGGSGWGSGSGSASHAGSGSFEDGSGGSGRGSGSGSASHAGSGSFEDGSGDSGWGDGSGSWDLPASIRGLIKSGYSHCSVTQAKVLKSTLYKP